MRLLSLEKSESVITITIIKDFNESHVDVENKLRAKIPQLKNKKLKTWIDVEENQQVFIFVENNIQESAQKRKLLLD